MSARRVRRTPVVLLAMLGATILFPRSCADVRVAVGTWLPSSAPLTPKAVPSALPSARTHADGAPPLPDEQRVWLLQRNAELEAQLAARPSGTGTLASLQRVARAAPRASSAVIARVLVRDLSPSRRTFLVGAGKRAGVVPGQPVLYGDSLVGIVTTVSDDGARVLRMDDRSAAVSVPASVLKGAGDGGVVLRGQGVARGTNDGALRVSLLPQDGALPGDFVVTGAGGDLIPEGLILGVVTSFGDDDRDGAFEAAVSPLRDLDELEFVTILLTEGVPLGTRRR